MKGFIFLVGGHKQLSPAEAISEVTQAGYFAPNVNRTSNTYGAVLADLMSARPGDRVFFFLRRGMHGVFQVVGNPKHPGVGAWLTHEGSLRVYLAVQGSWFVEPIDMDDLLMRPGNEVADSIRAMGGKSFFQLDPDEASWLEQQYYRGSTSTATLTSFDGSGALESALQSGEVQPMSLASPTLVDRLPIRAGSRFSSENLLHAGLLEVLRDPSFLPPSLPSGGVPKLLSLHHEYIASPAKQAEYIDRIDVLRVWGLTMPDGKLVPVHYECWEVKKDPQADVDFRQLLLQAMKYVDFMARQHCGGDYSRVSMRVLAFDYPESSKARDTVDTVARRAYQKGAKGQITEYVWTDMRCFRYVWQGAGKIGIPLGLIEVA